MNLNIAIGADHAGFQYKEVLKKHLQSVGYNIKDFGTDSEDSVDYPDFAHPLAEVVEKEAYSIGILICGSGNGVAITANKHQKVRAALCWNKEIAALARQHNNANVLCIPARFTSPEEAQDIAITFLKAAFEGERHERRVEKIRC